MEINGVSIIAYAIVAIFGAIAGQITDILNYFFSRHEKIFAKGSLKRYLSTATPKYLLMVIHILIYFLILYKYGSNNIDTVRYMILTPLIISVFYIDYKKQVIPNRLTLTIFECGIVFMFLQGIASEHTTSFIQGMSNINAVGRMLQGLIAGSVIFLIITLIGGIIFGKETMGFGDVKLMGALGLFFGVKGIIAVAVLAFLIASIYGIGLIIVQKIRHNDVVEYIAFGPFIVLAAFVVIFVPLETLMVLPFVIFSFGKYKL